jgi:putative membrane protein
MLKKLLILTIAVIAAAYILPGVHVNSIVDALVVAVILTLLNSFLKPILQIISFPITVLTLGLFLIVINVFVIYLADRLIAGFSVENWIWGLLFGLIISLITSLLEDRQDNRR